MSEVKARLALCREILDARTIMAQADDAKKIKATVLGERRIAAARRVLLGRASNPIADRLMSNSAASEHVLWAEVEAADSGRKHKAMAYAEEIASLMRALNHSERHLGFQPLSVGRTTAIRQINNKERDALVDENLTRGRIDPDILGEAAEAIDQLKPFRGANPDLSSIDPELDKALKQAREKSDHLFVVARGAGDAVRNFSAQCFHGQHADKGSEWIEQERTRLGDVVDQAWRDYNNALAEVKPLMDKQTEAVKAKIKEASQPLIEVGNKIIQDLAKHSAITPEQASDWANAQEITKAAVARFKKIGYPVDQVRQDMAEFYRLTGGRVPRVRVDSKGDRRANATHIDSHGKMGTINLDSAFDKRVLWHELAHHIEADPVAKLAAGTFIRRRSEDGKAYSLRSLTGNKGFRSNESAFKDHFFNEYVGKIYNDGMTEVFSMGVEVLSNPQRLAEVITKDPETIEFVMGFLKQPVDPMAQTLMDLKGQLVEANAEAIEQAASGLDDVIKALAALAPELDKDAQGAEWMGPWAWTIARQKGKQLGQIGDWYVFSESVRNYITGRKGGGLAVRIVKDGGLEEGFYPTKNLDVICACYAVFEKTGRWPSQYQVENVQYLKEQLQK